jgi:O-antigen/teichoic acid export membrane protein
MDNQFKKDFVKGSVATSLGTFISMFFQFLTIIILTRFLPAREYGLYILIVAVVNLFNILGGFGLELTLVKSISSAIEEEKGSTLIPVLLLRSVQLFFICIIFYLLGDFVLHFFNDDLNKYLFPIILLIIFSNYRDLFYKLLQGLKYFRQYAYVNAFSSFFRIIITFLYYYLNKLDLTNLIFIEILCTVQPLLHQIIVIPFKSLTAYKSTKENYLRIIKFSLPLYLNNILNSIYDRINVFIIGIFLTPISIAYYDVACKISEACRKIFLSFTFVYFPNLSTLFSKGEKGQAVQLINKSITSLSLVVSTLFFISFLFKEEIVTLFFSVRYLATALPFSLMILVFYFSSISHIMGSSLISAGNSSAPVKVGTISSILSIGGGILLIPAYGVLGAVSSLMIMNITSQILSYMYLRKENINVNVKKYLTPLIIALTLIGVYLIIPTNNILIKISIAVLFIIINWYVVEEFKKLFLFTLRNFKLRKRTV